jgi:hypothetical protein
MGVRGPVPKRSDQRVRRNTTGEDGLETTTIPAIGEVEAPELALGVETHPLVVDLWASLPRSAQTRFWEPTDWEYARITLYAVNEMLRHPKGISAMKLTAVNSMLASLLLTEADRRRVRLEIERAPAGEGAQVFDAAHYFKQRLAE